MDNQETQQKKEIARDCAKGLKSNNGLYDEGQVAVACMTAIDKWNEFVLLGN